MDCPACGGPVTLEVGPDRLPSTSLSDAVLDAAEDERRLRVEAIETTAGDADAIERARLLEEITDELEAIEALGTLEDTLAEVRRQRRLEPAAEDTNENATE